jgi:hypothetical protein
MHIKMKKKEKQMTLKISIVVISMLIPSMGISQTKSDSVQHLKEVTVTGVRPLIKADLDKFTYNVAYDPDSKSQSILEMLRKVPMVTVDGTDQIKVNGSSDFRVYVNGKPNTMMSNKPAEILKGMPASTVKKIEVITNPGAKYDAEGVAGILNIITESSVRLEGYNLNIGGALTTVAQSTNISAIMKVGKLTLSVSDGLSFNRPPKGYQETERTTFGPNASTILADATHKTKAPAHFFEMESSYELDKNNLLSISAGVENYTSKSWTDMNTVSTILPNTRMYSYANSHYARNRINGYYAGADFQHNFGAKGGNIVFSYRYMSAPSKTDASSIYSDILDANNTLELTDMQTKANLGIRENTGQIDYTITLKRQHTISVGTKYIHRINKADNEEYARHAGSDAAFTLDPYRSIAYKQTTDIAAAYTEYSLRMMAFSLTAGARYEYSSQEVSYPSSNFTERPDFKVSFNHLVPSISTGYRLGNTKMISLAYAMRISRPNIWNLNPYEDKTSPTVIKVGNPNLETATSHGFSLTYSDFRRKGGYNLKMGMDLSDDGITEYSSLNAKNELVTTYGNILNRKNTYLNLFARYMLTKTTNLSVNANVAYTDFKSSLAHLHNHGFTGNGSVNMQQRLPYRMTLSAIYAYSSRSLDVQGYRDGNSVFRLMLMRSFLKEDRLTITLYGYNIFTKELRIDNVTEMPDFRNRFTSIRRDYRILGVTAGLRLGKLRDRVKRASKSIQNDDIIQEGNPRAADQ